MNKARREIEEIKAIHKLEPTLRDIYVEGRTDVIIFEDMLIPFDMTSLIVYTIDSVNITVPMLQSSGLTDGNKQRVIFLGEEIAKWNIQSALCVIDRDEDIYIERSYEKNNTIYTDYSNSSAYIYGFDNFSRIAKHILHVNNSLESFYNSFFNILRVFFALRITKRKFSLNGPWVDISKSLEYSSERYLLNETMAIERFIHSEGIHRNEEIKDYISSVLEISRSFPALMYYNSHDFDHLFMKYASKLSNLTIREDRGVFDLFMPSFKHSETIEESLIKRIRSWYDTGEL